MPYRKFSADKIFTGTDLSADNHVLITHDNGMIEDIVPANEAGDGVEKLKGWLSPGFINCHCHLELSHMRGLIPEKTGLVDFVFSVVTQRHFAEDEIFQAIADAENEMLENGIVAVGDICNNLHTLHQKQKRNLPYFNFIEASGWLPGVAVQRFEKSKLYFDSFLETNQSSIVPHAPYSVSHELWQLIKPFFANKVATIHNQETRFEDELFLHNTGDFVRMYKKMKIDNSHFNLTGKSSLQSYYPDMKGAANTILVHNTFTQTSDIRFAQLQAETVQQSLFWCICINANVYIESALPPINELRKQDQKIVLGTDSLASNHSLSIWDEIRTIRRNFPGIPLEEVLGWATINGANALQLEDTLGSFEKGKMPGVLLLDGENVKRLV